MANGSGQALSGSEGAQIFMQQPTSQGTFETGPGAAQAQQQQQQQPKQYHANPCDVSVAMSDLMNQILQATSQQVPVGNVGAVDFSQAALTATALSTAASSMVEISSAGARNLFARNPVSTPNKPTPRTMTNMPNNRPLFVTG